MSNSLRDQLLKVGLVDEDKLKSVEKSEKQQKRAKSKKGKRKPKAERRAEAQQAPDTRRDAERRLRDRAERDRDAARAQRLREEKRARKLQIAEIIDRRRHLRKDGEIAYNFVDGRKVKHIYVTEKLRDGLSAGRMDIVRSGNSFEVVDASIAEKLRLLDGNVVLPRRDRSVEEEEAAYADHPIPDDLDW
ncbi:MAG: DUF2058 family protein [Pseudomonadales bacterium]|nr:DUF2058 family protein [Pseudomonadales bacterium]